jgi:hypothetical protein
MASKLVNESEGFMSLYDFLGHAAGSQLGKDVYIAAFAKDEPHGKRSVTTPKYTGAIMTYREAFLKEYFSVPRHNDATNTMTTPSEN